MKYVCENIIDRPLQDVAALWNNEEYFERWQEGFKSIKLISGTKDQTGAVSQILLEQGKNKMELEETILVSNLPEEKLARYVHIHMTNTQRTSFKEIEGNKTLHTSSVEYESFSGFMPKLMAKLFPSMFRKQSQKWMDNFKAFAEMHLPA